MLVSIGSGVEKVETSAIHYISIPAQLYADLCEFVDHYDTEVSGCGMVERVEHRTKSKDKDDPDTVEIEFRISEVYLPGKQDNTGSSTDITDDVIAELMSELLAKGKDTEHLRLHWHSHADMDTFHSGTDEDNYATLSNGEFLVSLVINKAHKFLGRIDYFKPVRVTLTGVAVYMRIDNEYKPSEGALKSIKVLDKYTKDKPKVTYVSGAYQEEYSGFGFGGNMYGKQERVTYNAELDPDEIEVARQLDINIAQAKAFKGCMEVNKCYCCKFVVECEEFKYLTGNYDC